MLIFLRGSEVTAELLIFGHTDQGYAT
jgi:hypothetical protein